jgi:hypothetical protein
MMNVRPANLDKLTQGLSTKSDKIRSLGRAGVPTSDIARFLDIRYQHARNVLKDAGLLGGQESPADVEAEPGKQRVWLEISADGSVKVPAPLLSAAGLKPGGRAFARLNGSSIEFRSKQAALDLARETVRKHVAPGVSLVDELLADRRAEALREEEGA